MPPQGRLEIDADRLTALQGSGVSALECAFGQLRGCSQLRTSQVADPPFASALIVAKAKSFVAQLLPQNPILLLEIVDRIALLLTEPACDRNH
jgi:hypothetical protein